MEKTNPSVDLSNLDKVCRESIWSNKESDYGPDYNDHLLEQYKAFVTSINYTSEMKLKFNSYFLGINTALITSIGFAISKQSFNPYLWHFLIPLAGFFAPLVWWAVTYSYKQRNIIKLHILHCIEEKLPLALYKTEWDLMNIDHNHWLKKFFFRINLFIPIVFSITYLMFIILI